MHCGPPQGAVPSFGATTISQTDRDLSGGGDGEAEEPWRSGPPAQHRTPSAAAMLLSFPLPFVQVRALKGCTCGGMLGMCWGCAGDRTHPAKGPQSGALSKHSFLSSLPCSLPHPIRKHSLHPCSGELPSVCIWSPNVTGSPRHHCHCHAAPNPCWRQGNLRPEQFTSSYSSWGISRLSEQLQHHSLFLPLENQEGRSGLPHNCPRVEWGCAAGRQSWGEQWCKVGRV